MRMFTCRDEFYRALWEDFSDPPGGDRAGCFYCGYIKSKKDAMAEALSGSAEQLAEYAAGKRPDKYILLRAAYLAYSGAGTLSREEYGKIFAGAASSGGGGKKLLRLFEEDPEEAEKKLERDILIDCARDFFCNEGFKSKDGEYNDAAASRHRKEKYGYADLAEMMYRYIYMYKGEGLTDGVPVGSGISVAADGKYIEKCSALFRAVRREKKRDTLIPLYFDENSGAGIYIAANRWLGRSGTGCSVCVLRFCDILLDTEGCVDEEVDLVMAPEVFDTVQEAFDRLRTGVLSGEYLEDYAPMNGFFPAGADECFRSRMTSEMPAGAYTEKEKKIIREQSALEKKEIAALKKALNG